MSSQFCVGNPDAKAFRDQLADSFQNVEDGHDARMALGLLEQINMSREPRDMFCDPDHRAFQKAVADADSNDAFTLEVMPDGNQYIRVDYDVYEPVAKKALEQ